MAGRTSTDPSTTAHGIPARVLPTTVLVLLTGTAVYFAGSATAPAIVDAWGLGPQGGAALTWSVQAGFIVGTVTVAVTGLADRFRAQRSITALLVLAAVANAGLVLVEGSLISGIGLRFAVGLLAGPVYPLGMRLLATWYDHLGWELGVLLGAYTLGAGTGAVLRAFALPWEEAILGASAIAVVGALLAATLLREGPLLPPPAKGLDLSVVPRSFEVPAFRASSLAYFGHMWELFALWGLLPFWLAEAGLGPSTVILLLAGVFVAGAIGCVLTGAASRRWGSATSARVALVTSGLIALASPFLFDAPFWLTAPVVLVWGAAVVADSPMFSAISARAAPRDAVGSALTVQNSIGFAITIVSIALVPEVAGWLGWRWALVILAPGPLLALGPVGQLIEGERGDREGDPDAGSTR